MKRNVHLFPFLFYFTSISATDAMRHEWVWFPSMSSYMYIQVACMVRCDGRLAIFPEARHVRRAGFYFFLLGHGLWVSFSSIFISLPGTYIYISIIGGEKGHERKI